MNELVFSILPLVGLLSVWLFSFLVLAFTIWMLMDAWRRSSPGWFLIILLVPTLGAILYFLSFNPKLPKNYRKPVRVLLVIGLLLVSFFLIALVSPSFT